MNSSDWKALLADEPDNELICFSYAKALLEEKNWAASAEVFQKLVEMKPDYALAWAFLARARLQAGDRIGARAACEAGMPVALKQRHEVPADEINAVLEELDSEF